MNSPLPRPSENISLIELKELGIGISRLHLLEEIERLEGSLIEFFKAAWTEIDPAPFQLNWHHEAIAEHLEAVAHGEIRKLCINIPPRHGKTVLTSVVFPAWLWALRPDPQFPLLGPQAKFLCLSYGDQLVMDNATTARRLLSSQWFQSRWGKRVKIAGDQDAKNKFDTVAGGTRISASFSGTVTGRGADIRILDDPHKVDEAESDAVREGVIRTYDGTLKSRVTDPAIAAEIIIAHRLHEEDLCGHVLHTDREFVHLCLPAEYEWRRHCVTALGWNDPRGTDDDGKPLVIVDDNGNRYPRDSEAQDILEQDRDGLPLWPDRWGAEELAQYKVNPYEWSGQWQQAPTTRGGNIFKSEWWQPWEPEDGKFPPLDYVVASLDSAFTTKESNDPSGFTIWGVFAPHYLTQTPTGTMLDTTGSPRVILLDAWRKHLAIHGEYVDYLPEEEAGLRSSDERLRKAMQKHYDDRSRPLWGLVEWVAYSCRRFKVDTLLIEAKASGLSVAQEMRRLYADEAWSVIDNPVKGDKVARAHAVVGQWARGLIHAPDREWAEMVIDEMSKFPKGKHDDLTDSATQAIKHMRERGILERPEEHQRAEIERMRHRPKSVSLYPM